MKDLKLKMWNIVPQEVRDELTLILFDDFSGDFSQHKERKFFQGFLAVHGLVRGYTTRKDLKLSETEEQILDLVFNFEKIDPSVFKDPEDVGFGAGAALYRGMVPKSVVIAN